MKDDMRDARQLKDVRADAWDEGYRKAMETAMSTEAFEDDRNPYRTEPTDSESGPETCRTAYHSLPVECDR